MLDMNSRQLTLILSALIAVLAIVLAILLIWGPSSPSTVPPIPSISPTSATGLRIQIDSPQAGAQLLSPFELRGRIAGTFSAGTLVYRVFDASNALLSTSSFSVATSSGLGVFATVASYSSPASGNGRVEVVAFSPLDGSVQAQSAVTVTLRSNTTTPVATQPAQQITLDSPPPGTSVGSPVVITGRVARLPQDGRLRYRFSDANGAELGAGSFNVSGTPGQPISFAPSLSFNLPPNGGSVRVEIVDQDARATLDLVVLPPQQAISIESPAPGTQVGSPVVITGRTNRYPAQGRLSYRIVDAGGAELATGSFGVTGTEGQSASFNASLTFALPVSGGPVRIDLFEPAANGGIVASTSITLLVASPQPQQAITIDTPAEGTQVGSPVLITGRTATYPFQGNLNYRMRDAVSGAQLGSGTFPVVAFPGQPGRFTAQLTFTMPPNGGPVRLELFDQNTTSGQVLATAVLNLVVAAPVRPTAVPPTSVPATRVPTAVPTGLPATRVPATATVTSVPATSVPTAIASATSVPPTASATSVPPTASVTSVPATATLPEAAQEIIIDAPQPGNQVTNEVTVSGRLSLAPTGGRLYYRLFDDGPNQLGAGTFVVATPRTLPILFSALIRFTPPAGGGPLTIEIYDQDSDGTRLASATVQVVSTGYPAPIPR